MDPVTAFKDLPPSCMVNIFSRLAPHECAAAACVCQLWSQVASEDSLWRPHLAADYATSSCTGYDGAAAASFKYVPVGLGVAGFSLQCVLGCVCTCLTDRLCAPVGANSLQGAGGGGEAVGFCKEKGERGENRF